MRAHLVAYPLPHGGRTGQAGKAGGGRPGSLTGVRGPRRSGAPEPRLRQGRTRCVPGRRTSGLWPRWAGPRRWRRVCCPSSPRRRRRRAALSDPGRRGPGGRGDAAFRQGVMLIHGCKEGQCSACKSLLLDGDLQMGRYSTFVLPDFEKDEGYVLLCRSHAYSDVEIELVNYDEDMIRSGLRVSSDRRLVFVGGGVDARCDRGEAGDHPRRDDRHRVVRNGRTHPQVTACCAATGLEPSAASAWAWKERQQVRDWCCR
ncbi:2Fe-2S iron-sulfur cluster-binding protein [Streptomyces silvisoli]|uniref:2Fe-2S iron-sulfur cluster-binding protein n=1 Tax=Streptomyces silvisoli TaxID=3034235 RepID=A0ABT5ZP80_9ACTN|nr:2Fe-2S iron-sulfur cluster-binding protein [Streptomyces silvisoli]MDF3291635.1 2Fe-2S iron-sulfur cluster-binding protein [Streptomyces silvisoli]